MKKMILALLLVFNVFGMSESNTDTSHDTQCYSRGFYGAQQEIDEVLAQNKIQAPVQEVKGSVQR